MNAQVMIIPGLTRQQHYESLMDCSHGLANDSWFAQIIASWLVGESVLPDDLGLPENQFKLLLEKHFGGYALSEQAPSGKILDFSRMLEKQDLEQLLCLFATSDSEEIEWLIAIIVAACLGSDHLWYDLGLWSRSDLSAMLQKNFPALAALNSKDMKWKKFLYKQLCEAEGLYLCRAPSCEVCKDFSACFGPEV